MNDEQKAEKAAKTIEAASSTTRVGENDPAYLLQHQMNESERQIGTTIIKSHSKTRALGENQRQRADKLYIDLDNTSEGGDSMFSAAAPASGRQ